ncbi:MAG: sporulation protein YunB [Firmicutes bacterium]|nr:sporulation protein YunB [Bacillota bacterium]
MPLWRRRRARGYGPIRLEIPPYKRRQFTVLVFLGLFFGVLVFTFYFIDLRLRPVLRDLALARAKALANNVVNRAVAEGVAREIDYEDLIAGRTDRQVRPVLLRPNTGALNRLAARITLDVQRALGVLAVTKVSVPFGQVLGAQVLGTWGPQVPVRLLPVGMVEGKIVDYFDVAGINPTRHRSVVRIETEVKVVVPLGAATTRLRTEVPLAEAVIVGEVPDFYLDGLLPSLR